MRRLGLGACLVTLAIGLTGCNVATQNSATPLPPQLTLPPTTATTTTVAQGTHQLNVYFLKGGRLVAVPYPYSTDPLVAALSDLSDGPLGDSARQGITTAFSEPVADVTSSGTRDGGKVALVDVDIAFLSLPGEFREAASAQIVFTVTCLADGPTSVQFLFNTNPLEALVPPGQLVNRPVTRADYSAFGPVGSAC